MLLQGMIQYGHLNPQGPQQDDLSGKELLRQIPHGQKFFCKLDALSGFHQIELHPDSWHITTFIIERGTFIYLRCPQGLNASGDEFIRRSDDAIKGCKGYKKLVDDILVWGRTLEELKERVWNEPGELNRLPQKVDQVVANSRNL